MRELVLHTAHVRGQRPLLQFLKDVMRKLI